MKLLLDENLSPALVNILTEIYPGTAHVRDLGLKSAPDPQVWAHAASGGYVIVTQSSLDSSWELLNERHCRAVDLAAAGDSNVSTIIRALISDACVNRPDVRPESTVRLFFWPRNARVYNRRKSSHNE